MNWSVARVNDDGRFLVMRDRMRAVDAEALAGRMRDRQSDEDVGAGWNVLAFSAADVARRQKSASRVVQTAVAATKAEEVWLGRMSADFSAIESR